MDKPSPYTEWMQRVRWLPAIDWNVKFFGGHLQSVDYGWSVPPEAHIGFELNLLIEGEQETIMEDSYYKLKSGDILLIPPGFRHANRCVSRGGMRYFTAHFNVDDPEFQQRMIRQNRILFRKEEADTLSIRSIADKWIALLGKDGEYGTEDRFHIQTLLFELFGLLARLSASDTGVTDKWTTPSSLHYARAVAEALKSRFNSHSTEEDRATAATLRIEDIAASLGIAPGYAQEVFRQVYGISPRQYLSELILHEAKLLLQQPKLSLTDIATKLGYSNLSHFSRQFKRWTGSSPLLFRQSQKDKKY